MYLHPRAEDYRVLSRRETDHPNGPAYICAESRELDHVIANLNKRVGSLTELNVYRPYLYAPLVISLLKASMLDVSLAAISN